jgi:hypothetical protein
MTALGDLRPLDIAPAGGAFEAFQPLTGNRRVSLLSSKTSAHDVGGWPPVWA